LFKKKKQGRKIIMLIDLVSRPFQQIRNEAMAAVYPKTSAPK
jgi:hypothetical protein